MAVGLQGQIGREREPARHAGAHAVLGNEADPQLDSLQGGRTGDVDVAQEDLAPLGTPQATYHLGELALTVAGHAGHPHDLGLSDFEIDIA